MRSKALALFGIMALVLVVLVPAALSNPQPKQPKKVYVCKYVGTPGVDERLQTGGNPIEVSANAIDGDLEYPDGIGFEFADAHGRSIVIGWVGTDDVPLPVLTIEDCPEPDNPPDECPNIPGDQPPGTNCEQNDPVDVEAGVVFTDGTCDTLPFIDVLETEGVFYTHGEMTVGDHEVAYLSSGIIVAHDEAEDDDVRLVGQMEFPFAFTFDPVAEECENPPPPPPPCVECPTPDPPPIIPNKPDDPSDPDAPDTL